VKRSGTGERGTGRRAPAVTDRRLDEVGEERLVELLLRGLPTTPDVRVGAGDDCAVLAGPPGGPDQLLKTDCLVEGVHFAPDTDPALAGRKAMNRTLSDIAAMAGKPVAALVTLVLPPDRSVGWVTRLYRGLNAAAGRAGVAVVGGETASSGRPGSAAVVSVSLLGKSGPRGAVLRSGARPGDTLFVTGRLGGSLPSGRHLKFTPRLREAEWLARHLGPTAMMDLSDGLAQDLPRLAARSGVGFELDLAALPRHRGCSVGQAVCDGEDYELLFTVRTHPGARRLAAWKRTFPRIRLTCIGKACRPGEGDDQRLPRGWQHFG
jgi:thiamine-monophosphate kinase